MTPRQNVRRGCGPARLRPLRGCGVVRRRGAVLLIVVISLTLLVGLVFYAYNLGGQVNRRLGMQNTADAVAISGAGWMARSMNVIAMNNVGQAKLISLSLVLDSLPLASELALVELETDQTSMDSLARGLADQLNRGLPDSRLEQGPVADTNIAPVVADAILFMPSGEPVAGPAWPGDAYYDTFHDRVNAVGKIVDNGSGGFSASGNWSSGPSVNEYGGDSQLTLDPSATATWQIPLSGQYDVYAWWSSDDDGSHRWNAAEYTIHYAGGNASQRRISQNNNSGAWVHLGNHRFDGTARVTLRGPSQPSEDHERVNFLVRGLEKYRIAVTPDGDPTQKTDYDELEALDEALDSPEELDPEGGSAYDIRRTTWWDGPDGRGDLWEAALTLKELSIATAEAAGLLAQANAERWGRANGAEVGFVVPLAPEIPAQMGDFEDFEPLLTGRLRVRIREPADAWMDTPIGNYINRINSYDRRLDEILIEIAAIQQQMQNPDLDPAEYDQLDLQLERLMGEQSRLELRKEQTFARLHHYCPGGATPDFAFHYRLGPYARLHRWRWNWHEQGTGQGPGWSGNSIFGPSHRQSRGPVIGYTTYGPYRWTVDQVSRGFGLVGRRAGGLDSSRFAYYAQLGANIKLGYLYGVQKDQTIKFGTQWITDYQQARAFASDPENRRRIIRTRYYTTKIMSSLSWDHPDWLRDRKTYWGGRRRPYPFDDPPSSVWVWEPRGWNDVANRRSLQQVGNYVWRWQIETEDVRWEPRINLMERRSASTGEVIPWSLYSVQWFVFGGIEIGEEAVVSDPANWPDDTDDIPAPLLMDVSDGDYVYDHDAGVRRERFTVLGVARHPTPAKVWPQQFRPGNPTGATTTIAQAEIFNNSSWDLWTQDWQVKLVPVSQWNDWQRRLAEDQETMAYPEILSDEDLRVTSEYFNSLSPPFVETFVNH